MAEYVPSTQARNQEMNQILFSCVCVTITILIHNFASGQRIEQKKTDDLRKWQWYLSDTAVSINVTSAWKAGYTGKGILVAVVDDGVDYNHPDLVSNFNHIASYDFLKGSSTNPNRHGTNCAGIIAGGNNTKCGVGVAFDAQISSIRLYDDDTRSTDQSEAKALSFKREMIDIYSNSWGHRDTAWGVEGPGPRLKKFLEEGTRLGRNKKGSIFVFAAGNGGVLGDSCAFSGYVNNIHTIAISGVNWDGSIPAYSEACAAIMAVTYGQDMFKYGKIKPPLVTTKGANECTERFPGTSGTAAMASGIIALALQANSELTWRDVQHLIARSSRPLKPPYRNRQGRNLPSPSWIENAAFLKVSSHYGFGLMDARKLTVYAKEWSSVPPQLSCEIKLNISNSSKLEIPSLGDLRLTLSLNPDNCSIRYLEHMQAEVNLRFNRGRGYLEMSSTSPSGTRSKLLYSRVIDTLTGYRNFTDWRVTSLHYWGEKPIGDWDITIRNTKPSINGKGRVFGLKLIFYGTKEDPLQNNTHVDRNPKKIEIVKISDREKEIPIHGGYSRWSYWSRCNKRCGGGTRQRVRHCNNPEPENGGKNCLGRDRQTRSCNTHSCPVHGGYSSWGSWSECSVTCGAGSKQRSRTCTNPPPAHGGRNCLGKSVQSQECRRSPCQPVHGGYSSWGSWSGCSVTCGKGSKQRSRTCTNPPPAHGGRYCNESSMQSQECHRPCLPGSPTDGGYTPWSPWSACSRTCAGGSQQRYRFCTDPLPVNGGKDCKELGPDTESKGCNRQSCQACTNIATDRDCQYWFNDGHCSDPTVSNACKRTCGRCQVAACTNLERDSRCQKWSDDEWCSDPTVKKLCQKTCHLC